MKRILVLGGGIAGLTTALHLGDRANEVPGGIKLVVLEGRERPGGNIRTDREEGFIIEWGPNGYLDNVPSTPALVQRLGLEEHVQEADESAAARFLYRSARLHQLPTSPLRFLGSPVLSLKGRLRVMMEPFARAAPAGEDETIYQFARRRIGEEAARILIDAMVSGVFAGNIDKLSLRSTFPKMAAMEAEHGSLVKAMLARMKERRAARKQAPALAVGEKADDKSSRTGGPAGPGGSLTSFRAGLEVIIEALAKELGDTLRLGQKVVRLEHAADGGSGWQVTTMAGPSFAADAVVIALPAPRAVPILAGLDRELAKIIDQIPTAGLAVIALGYDTDDLGKPPRGFGFLVPRGEGPRILGCLWDSSIFPGRAPAGKVLLRAMIGGAHDPEAVSLDDETLLSSVREELATTMGITAKPILTRIYRHPLGIGQYVVGHQTCLDAIHRRLRKLPGLWVSGSSYYGVSMNACIEKAGEQATEILNYLNA